ncbi:RluA family pseudouridine synthase [Mariniblastus sp.]|jgi:23S rRNA pseudouridine1911/1915/1917 synthase|nr:RluA family pseudouridine synthase [Mariniblastus sp.]MDB4396222.1 RluA family pseudouridine synthase [bacterium]MDA7925221.1 RluA family pseudouridine synthase [Mariniblastus sp.]MDB4368489.1 RluA family pseudouridine synthase [Mariniblastus sp.]MDB4372318.1 RluA family pseudouridine synthase [Mariniblastus sp.]
MINDESGSASENPNSQDTEQSADWQTLTVTEEEHLERLDAFLVRHFPKFSRVKLQRAIAAKQVRVAGNQAKSSTRLKREQKVEFRPPQPEPENTIPEDIPLDILFEDDHLVAINKPPSMVVHPAKGHWSGTLTAALAFHFQQLSSIGGATRPGIVHRLDRDTSGVILVAKSDTAHINLASQFEKRLVEKEYFAIVSPSPNHDRDIIDKPIGAHPYQREKKAIRIGHSTSRNASSFFEVIERFQGFASVRVKPKTGRTHQIRVHMAHIGCSVLCDRLYSGRAKLHLHDLTRKNQDQTILLERQALHARHIKFKHPIEGREMSISAPIPDDIEKTEQAIRELRPLT